VITPCDVSSIASGSQDGSTETERLVRSQSWLRALENTWYRETLGQTKNFSAVRGMELQRDDSEGAAKSENFSKALRSETVVSQNALLSSRGDLRVTPQVKWYDVYRATQHSPDANAFSPNHSIAENLHEEGGNESTKYLTAGAQADFELRTFLDNSKWATKKITLLSPDKNSLEVWMRDNEIDKSEMNKFISGIRSEFEVGKQRSLKVFLNGKIIYSTHEISSESEG
jgi:hypothetical protein